MKVAVGLLLIVTIARPSLAACPTESPASEVPRIAIYAPSPPCFYGKCATGSTVSFEARPLARGFFPPAIYDPGYVVQACDTVKWNFGDGSPEVIVHGSRNVQHAFNAAGTVTVSATVSNSLGSATTTSTLVLTDDPFISVGNGTGREGDGTVSVPITRFGGMTRGASLLVSISPSSQYRARRIYPFSEVVRFEPGETEHSVVVPLLDNALYDGSQFFFVTASEANGAILARSQGSITTRDDEAQPTASVDDVAVLEGKGGVREIQMTLRLSAPISERLVMFVEEDDPRIRIPYPDRPATTATRDEDFVPDIRDVVLEPGQLTGTFGLVIHGDATYEPDEIVRIDLSPDVGAAAPWMTRQFATCTILNDDARLDPTLLRLRAGTVDSLRFAVGFPVPADTPVELTSDRGALTFPSTVFIRAGEPAVDIPFVSNRVETSTVHARATTSRATLEAEATVEAMATTVLTARPAAIFVNAGKRTIIDLSFVPPVSQPYEVFLSFAGTAGVGVPSTVTIPSGGSAEVTLEGMTEGEGDLSVSVPDLQASAVLRVTVGHDVPSIETIVPASGSSLGGTPVEIGGEGFTSQCTVTFGGLPATNVAASSRSLSVITPAHAPESVDVQVTCPSGAATKLRGFKYATRRRAASS